MVALLLCSLQAAPVAVAADAAAIDPMQIPEYLRALQELGTMTAPGKAVPAPPAPPADWNAGGQEEGLQSIQRGSKGSSAVIDGQRYRVGDTYGKARVVAILPNRVLLEEDGQQSELSLYPGLTKTARPASGQGSARKTQRKELTP